MNDYKKINNITGWVVFILAAIVYWITVEETASFWDCGEFIAVSYKLEVPHPPGAPFFLLIGRIFSFLAMGNVKLVAYWINIVSVLSSGFTILFLFWTITLFGKKLFNIKEGTETPAQTWLLMAGGVIGALAFTFTDSFWFSAVEAEVYAMSSFFTAFVVWAILKWENIEDESLANKWIVLICYMMGLSIGVHLLNLVTIPALALIIYFKKYKPTTKGIIVTMIVGGLIIILINNIIIPGFPSIAGWMEINLVNTFGLPFGSGTILFGILLLSALVYGIYYSNIHQKVLLNTALLGFAFIMIGYSSYTMVVIRSNFNPPIDENNPENIVSFVSYLKREQYGSRPLLKGQYFDAEIVDQKMGEKVYVKGKDKYEVSDQKIEYVYDPKRTTFLPRAYSSDPNHVQKYRQWMGLGQNEKPNFIDNIEFMLRYQIGYMYMRYFMWNFSGRDSDIQGAPWLAPWESTYDIPESYAQNKGRNQYFMLPFILGIIGLFFQFKRDQKSFSVVALLFFLTGIALVLYLNSPPVEPRERDYIYVGSYFAFSIWIGLGTIGIADFLNKKLNNMRTSTIVAFVVSLIVPTILAAENWDDHNRSDRYFSVDSAKNYLNSCEKNAILFTGGDNDTFPLWYAQEVEGVRTDVRVIVLSYFNTDWYIQQMQRQAYKSDPLPISLTMKEYRQGGPNDIIPYAENPQIKGAINLKKYMELVRKDHPAIKRTTRYGDLNTLPSKRLFLNIDSASVVSKGIIPEDKMNYLTDKMVFSLKGNSIQKNTLMIMDIIATNDWERPIYFNHTSLQGAGIDLNDYVIQEGNTYRLLPLKNPGGSRNQFVNTKVMYDNVMNKFEYRELDNPKVYYNEDYRNFVLNHRSTLNNLAGGLIQKNEMKKAAEVLNKSLEWMPDKSIPYDYTTAMTVDLLMELGEKEKAMEITRTMADRADAELHYFTEYDTDVGNEAQKDILILNNLSSTMKRYGENDLATEISDMANYHYQNFYNANRF